MSTFALIHGSGDSGWAWHLVQEELRRCGHGSVAPDLPTDREDATRDDCVDTLADAVEGAAADADDLVVAGHSVGGLLVPLVAERLGARLQVYVAGMVPAPGESGMAWFGDVGWPEAVEAQAREDGGRTGHPDPEVVFYHDVAPALAGEAMARERPTSERLGETPWPLPALPAIAARYVVTTLDRFIPPPVQRHVAASRLGITAPEEIESGHCATLSRPAELAGLLAGYADASGGPGRR